MKEKHPHHAATCAVTLLLGAGVPADSSGSAFPTAIGAQQPRSVVTAGPGGRTALQQNDARVPERLRKVFVEALMVKESQVTYDARLIEDLGFDSLKTVTCVAALQEAFSIEIPDEDAEKFLRVGDVVEYLRKRKVID